MNIEEFLECCREESLSIFQEHSGNKNINYLLDKQELNTRSNASAWNAFIFVGGSKFRFMFEVEFTTITLLSLAAEKFSDLEERDYIAHVKDFMREYCNLFAGKLKAGFEKNTNAFLSLPVISKDYDVEVLFGVSKKDILSSSWSMGEHKMRVDIKLHYTEREKFENYNFIKEHLKKSEDADEIEFF